MDAKEVAAAALSAALQEQFAQPVQGVEMWIWASPKSPDLDALIGLALKVGGEDVLTSIRPERLGLQVIVNTALCIFPWGSLSPAAFSQVAGLLRMQADVCGDRIHSAAVAIAQPPQPGNETDDGRTFH